MADRLPDDEFVHAEIDRLTSLGIIRPIDHVTYSYTGFVTIYFRHIGTVYGSYAKVAKALRSRKVRDMLDPAKIGLARDPGFQYRSRLYAALYKEDSDDRAAREAEMREE